MLSANHTVSSNEKLTNIVLIATVGQSVAGAWERGDACVVSIIGTIKTYESSWGRRSLLSNASYIYCFSYFIPFTFSSLSDFYR